MPYKKPSTPEEKEAAREASQAVTQELMSRIDTCALRLAEQLGAGASDELLTFMRFSARFHTYSLNNQLLIWLQAPEAAHVAGFQAWRGLGRSVRKGAKAVRVLAPLVVPDHEAPPVNGRPAQRIVGFKYSSIFADYDTEGDPLPSAAFMVVQGGDDGTCALLRSLTAACPVPVRWEDGEGRGAHGWTDGGQIVLCREKCDLEPAHALRVFFHEWAHVSLHFQGAGKRAEDLPDRQTRELEADAAAYVLSSFYGVETTAAVADYITTWGGNAEKLHASMTRIGRAVSSILGALRCQGEPVARAAA
ncbi:ArdC family protein [Deinococcus koreensis]|uniref:N-terminal domain-containing protein n=1 Tax=Deinococcus koreensis TaxID=2054903 RepID=A0A2K3URV8_9DEIO|nr:ArdC family protein [Deinococcus koreensis]PNY79254.1 hypothetical protein CVO96_20275 [Deinococcus koreensis]